MHKNMKKFLLCLAKIFKVDLVTEKIIYRDKIVEVPKIVEKEVIKEVPVEIIKEVPKEVIKEVEVIKYIPNPDLTDAIKYEGYVDDSLTIDGNFLVKGILTVTGEVTCHKIMEV